LLDTTERVIFYKCVVAIKENGLGKGKVFFETAGQVSVQYLKIYI